MPPNPAPGMWITKVEEGTMKPGHALPFGFSMILPAFRGVYALGIRKLRFKQGEWP
ncbi:MAG: hypothetical protein RIS94_148 [Pseudomonadota bacterium]